MEWSCEVPALQGFFDVVGIDLGLGGSGLGEDGAVQEILDGKGIPYTGSGPGSSRLSFDKVASKRRFEEHGIPTPCYEVLHPGDGRELPLPVVVKPARQGSSIGLRRVLREADWAEALQEAFSYDEEVVVEAYIAGRELTVGVLDGRPLPVIDIAAPQTLYDYRAKYTSGVCEYRVPALIDDALRETLQAAGTRVYDVLGCRGFCRVDFRLSPEGEVFVLEMNTIPGFTETSLLPKAAAAAGIPFPELCSRIMDLAAVSPTDPADLTPLTISAP